MEKNKWARYKNAGYWRKLLYHDWFIITDDWGEDKYKIHIWIFRTFSFRNGFSYQIQAPDIVINSKDKWKLMCELLRFVYKGDGCPVYYRLCENLRKKGLWKQL